MIDKYATTKAYYPYDCGTDDQFFMNIVVYQSGLSYNKEFEGYAINANPNVDAQLKEHYNGTHLLNSKGKPFAIIHKWGETAIAKKIVKMSLQDEHNTYDM